MVDSRAQADRILVAQLTGEARFRSRWRDLTADEEAAAVASLRELAGGRGDLLAEVAGIFEGTSEGEMDEPLTRRLQGCAARPEPIRKHSRDGLPRVAGVGKPPFSGGVR